MSGRESKLGVTSMTRGTNLVKKFRDQAMKRGQSVFIGQTWDAAAGGRPGGMGIWLYGPGEATKVRQPVATAASLDELYGRA